MADENNGIYTETFTSRLDREGNRKMAEVYLQRAAPHELVQSENDLKVFKGLSTIEQQAWLVQQRRGSTWELLLQVGALVGLYGAGQAAQHWFPYTWGGRVPVIPTVLGTAGLLTGVFMKTSSSFRTGVALAGVGFALGGGSVSGEIKL